MNLSVKVNGKKHSVDVDDDTPLLWVLRDVLGMTGTKFGCGMALCGACTVHVDGVADPLLRDAGRRRRHVGRSRRSRRSARRTGGAACRRRGSTSRSSQCGYCQSGQIMSAAALLASNPQPERRRHRRRDVGQHLPLRHLSAHPRGHQAGGAIAARKEHREADMTALSSTRLPRARPAAAAGLAASASMLPAAAAHGQRRRRAEGLRAERLHPHRRATGR